MLTRRIGTAAAALALCALAPAAAQAKDGANRGADSATKACQAERAQIGRTDFSASYGSFGACVREQRDAEREAAAECRGDRAEMGAEAFAAEWAAAPTAAAASASGKGKGKGRKRKRSRRGQRPQPVDAAMARCVAETAKDILDEESADDDAPEGEDVDGEDEVADGERADDRGEHPHDDGDHRGRGSDDDDDV